MNYSKALFLATELLYLAKRVTYRRLEKEFGLDQDTIDHVCHELIVGRSLARNENGDVLVWCAQRSVPDAGDTTLSSIPSPSAPHLSRSRASSAHHNVL